METTETLDERDLKISSLLDRIASLTANYENEVANLRVTLTVVKRELDALKEKNVSEEAK